MDNESWLADLRFLCLSCVKAAGFSHMFYKLFLNNDGRSKILITFFFLGLGKRIKMTEEEKLIRKLVLNLPGKRRSKMLKK